MTNYTRGRQTEYEIRDSLRECGYEAIRTAGSHSPIDILGWNDFEILFNQIKRVKFGNKFYPSPTEINRFKNLSIPSNGSKWIITRIDSGKGKKVEWTFQCIQPQIEKQLFIGQTIYDHPLMKYYESKGIKYSMITNK